MEGLTHRCPVCFDTIIPPILQCRNGHLICEKCQPRVNHCPECRDASVTLAIRNLALENLMRTNTYDCPNKSSGCLLRLNAIEMGKHKTECDFGKHRFCRLLIETSCPYECRQEDIVSHMQHAHYDRPWQKKISWGVDGVISPYPIQFVEYGRQTFFFKTKIDKQNKCASWMVCLAKSRKSAEKFSAAIQLCTDADILNPSGKVSSTFKWNGPVYSVHEKFNAVRTLKVPLESIEDPQNPGNYSVFVDFITISDNSTQ